MVVVAAAAGGVVLIAVVVLFGICMCYKTTRTGRPAGIELHAQDRTMGEGTPRTTMEMNPMKSNQGSRPDSATLAPNFPRPISIARTAATGGMPKGWTSAIDEGTGEKYYYHVGTGVTQWEFPMVPRV